MGTVVVIFESIEHVLEGCGGRCAIDARVYPPSVSFYLFATSWIVMDFLPLYQILVFC